MLRISVASQSAEAVVLKLEGRVAREQVPLVEQELQSRSGLRLVLDLEGVRHLDAAGLDLLERWHQAGVQLRGGSLFVNTMLQSRGLIREPDSSPK